jgi:uncharacterized membrane protein (Fun14 family)
MLFLFKGRYGLAAKAAVGVILLVVGAVATSRVLLVIGAVLVAWAAISGLAALRDRNNERDVDE